MEDTGLLVLVVAVVIAGAIVGKPAATLSIVGLLALLAGAFVVMTGGALGFGVGFGAIVSGLVFAALGAMVRAADRSADALEKIAADYAADKGARDAVGRVAGHAKEMEAELAHMSRHVGGIGKLIQARLPELAAPEPDPSEAMAAAAASAVANPSGEPSRPVAHG